MLKRTLVWLVGQSAVERLLLAATVVAALRMMLIHGVFIGFDLGQWAWFGPVEVLSGLAFALLEGKALAYVSRLWVGLKPRQWAEWVYWGVLALGQVVLLGSIIGVTAFAATSVRRNTDIDALLGDGGAVAWSMFVTALNPLMVMLIGISRAVDPAEGELQPITTRKGREGIFSADELAGLLAKKRPDLTPGDFVVALEREGVSVSLEQAEAALLAAQLPVNGKGRR